MVSIRSIRIVFICIFFCSCEQKEPWEKAPKAAIRYCVLNNTSDELTISTFYNAGKQLQNEILKPGKQIQISWYVFDRDVGYDFPGKISRIDIMNRNGQIVTQQCEFKFVLENFLECDTKGTIFDTSVYTSGGKREAIYTINKELFDQ